MELVEQNLIIADVEFCLIVMDERIVNGLVIDFRTGECMDGSSTEVSLWIVDVTEVA